MCFTGYRGPSCALKECPSGPDPSEGYGNEAGRDCSGRGVCNYKSGKCQCFWPYYGKRCHIKKALNFS